MHPDSLNGEERAKDQDEKDKFAEEIKEAIARIIFNPPEDTCGKIENAGEILRMVDTLNGWVV